MARSAWLTLASMGLSIGTILVSFWGCAGEDATTRPGECEDDKNPCTTVTCVSGAAVHTAKRVGEPCALGANEATANSGTCDEAGMCQLDCLKEANGIPGMCKCTADSECPTEEPCATWACTAGTCLRTHKPDMTVAGTLAQDDCKQETCTAGAKNTVQDDLDTPDNAPEDCKKWICENQAPIEVADDTEMLTDTPNDCKKDVCKGGAKGFDNDDTDKPADTGCTVYTCNGGTLNPANASPGTQVMGKFCDSSGMLVDCLNKSDWDACGGKMCKAKLCPAEPCTANADCQGMFCADGFCCNTACTDECKSCGLMGKQGTCTNIPYLEADASYTDSFGNPNVPCVAPNFCNGAGKCLGGSGAPCTADVGCLGGKCAMPSKLCLGAKDEPCSVGGQCASGTCDKGKCT